MPRQYSLIKRKFKERRINERNEKKVWMKMVSRLVMIIGHKYRWNVFDRT